MTLPLLVPVSTSSPSRNPLHLSDPAEIKEQLTRAKQHLETLEDEIEKKMADFKIELPTIRTAAAVSSAKGLSEIVAKTVKTADDLTKQVRVLQKDQVGKRLLM